MSRLLQEVGRTVRTTEANAAAAEFLALAKFVGARHATGPDRDAEIRRLAPRAQIIAKAGISPAALADPTYSALSDYSQVATAFVESLRGSSVFDTLLANGMKRIPLRTRVAVVTSAMTGTALGEASIKPISSLAIAAGDLTLKKAAAVVAGTVELFRLGSPVTSALFENELRNGVSVATDQQFLFDLNASVTPTASSGNTTTNVLTDLTALLNALTLADTSKVFLIASPANTKALLLKRSSTGGDAAFPTLSLNGGEILPGIPVLVSSALPSGAILMVDATGLMGGTEAPSLRSITQGDIIMDTAPNSPPTAASVLVGLWATDQRAIICERFFAAAIARAGAVAAVSGASY